MSANAYPLQWPVGRRRWDGFRQSGKFKVSEYQATEDLFENLEYMCAEDIVVSSNRQPFSRSKANPDDPGVAVYFNRKGKELCIACDKWDRLEHNLRAIGLAAEAMRSIERWGTEDMVDAAFTGYTALPETIIMGEHTARAWWEVLQVSQNADLDIIEAAYKRMLSKTHPDHGGSDFAVQEVIAAFKQAKEAKRTT